jgi:PadR family transcriptional regulator, regulatory protein PadR
MKPSADQLEDMLQKWEEVYKRGLLSFWLLLLLSKRPAYPREIDQALAEISLDSISADDNSIYRALSRFEDMGIVSSELQQSELGPPRKYYRLNEMGLRLLAGFIQRNILIFEDPKVKEQIQVVLLQANHHQEA